ncbi:MAG: hypothetical protein H6815_10615 [Phycisphaeraceae bacterium]|nr:hypothetical protein [Phycisphaerales bacterium]MCB9860889.1 hypothetical protein [Phycisphaeraceae bacterium]
MRWGWLVNRFEDPQLRLTRAQRKQALKIVHEAYLKNSLWSFTLLAVVLPIFVAMAILMQTRRWVAALLGIMPSNAGLLIIAFAVILVWPWSAFMYGRFYAKPYRRALRDMGIDLCVNCGYSREGIAEDLPCPECGKRLAGSLNSAADMT